MDNLKYYNDSLAYDFEMFMPKPAYAPGTKDNIVAMPRTASKTRKRQAAATKALSVPLTLVLCACFILAALCGNITLRLKINEVNSEINDMKSAIAELDSEKTALEMEMQRRISFANLEVAATELGMKKPEKENVTYIRVNDKNAAITSDGSFVSE